MSNDRLEAAADRSEILEVAMTSLVCRDSGDMDSLAACFHPDALLTSSWFSGKASDFVEGARKALATRHPGDSQKHIAGNPRVSLNSDRAICEYYLTLYQRRTIDGYKFDFQTWSSFCDLFEQRNGAWRISRRWVIYEKDRMDAYKVGEVPESYFKAMDLSPFPPALRYHCWRNTNADHPPTKDLLIEGSSKTQAVRESTKKWLEGGTL
ncbi:MAG: nuclear transport factor 2 family protein [Nitrospinaceae bacterium]|jgi:hypothetical protein|nr:nuclear transport factor 2 family protein [Nitrospinaceae bacterium]MBT3432484.1 nuclear transport factor 2 family protein [Nitrospinaceae bacterium]MBT4095406.1 nuclear transport factor 2 family protein [Nitrospinaceae bacterium]MBT4430177.1 nuclear transport factor 2 family protein [Nitrospinaceae bacterium]MBT6394895.1 nuclear transport factor 2 family protein [Nitrospinaceae bacterium]